MTLLLLASGPCHKPSVPRWAPSVAVVSKEAGFLPSCAFSASCITFSRDAILQADDDEAMRRLLLSRQLSSRKLTAMHLRFRGPCPRGEQRLAIRLQQGTIWQVPSPFKLDPEAPSAAIARHCQPRPVRVCRLIKIRCCRLLYPHVISSTFPLSRDALDWLSERRPVVPESCVGSEGSRFG